jgi:cbb3-type cytochrome oxidase subunit 3
MIRDALEFAHATDWPQVALIIFVVAFMGVLVWTYRGSKTRFDRESRLPLEDGSNLENFSESKHAG